VTTIRETLTTRLGREEAFDYIADFGRQAEWDPNTQSSRRLDEGPIGVGSRFGLVVRVGRRGSPMEYRITEYEPPGRIVLVGEGSGIWSRDDIRFAEVEDGTRVDYEATILLSGVLGIVQPILGRAFATIGRRAVEGMRRELDARTGPGAQDGVG
jgi:hypothetical protein